MERKVFCRREEIWGDSISFFLRERYSDGISIGQPVVMKVLSEEDRMQATEPTFVLHASAAQSLMDSLWDCGLRPSEGSGSAGAMAATQKHLEDMRTLVFNPPAK
jgi:hypothetical protein